MERIANALANSYGPDGSTTLIRSGAEEKQAGVSAYTKDGHRILSSISFSKPIEMSILDDLKDITRNTVKTVGDGTTSAVILSYEIFKALNKLAKEFNINDKVVVAQLQKVIKNICEVVMEHKKECTLQDIYDIAYTATDGNETIAQDIYKLYEGLGMEVFIDVGISNTPETKVKTYEGLTLDAGYFNPSFINKPDRGIAEIVNPNIYIFEDPIDTVYMLNLCYKIIEDNLIGPFQEYGKQMQLGNQNKADKELAKMKATVIIAPTLGRDIRSKMDDILEMMNKTPAERRAPLLIITNIHDMDRVGDLAILSGAKTIKKYIDPEVMKADIEKGLAPTMETISSWFGGKAELISADMNTTKIIKPGRMYKEDGTLTDEAASLMANLNAQLKQYEETKTDLTDMYKLRKRIQSLSSNMVNYLIGGISYTDRDALKDAVEDAVLNCRNAAKNGVGYGANFEGMRAAFELYYNREASKESEYIQVLYAVCNAYKNAFGKIYESYLISKGVELDTFIHENLTKGEPYNLNGDGKVLTSIMTDQVTLNAIGEIVGLMFKTNQCLCSTPQMNTYTEL